MTPPEAKLWIILRSRSGGFKFRRQHPCGPFVLDFYCASAALAIEVDGAAHSMGTRPARDESRDAWCAAQRIKTLRFAAIEMARNEEAVVRAILLECEQRDPSTAPRSPSPRFA